MQDKGFETKINIIAKNTLLGLKEFEKLIKEESLSGLYFIEGVPFMIFDKNFNPYLVLPEQTFKKDKSATSLYANFDIYALQPKRKGHIDTVSMGRIYTQRHNCFNEQEINESLQKMFESSNLDEKFSKKTMESLKKDIVIGKRNTRYDELHVLEIEKRKFLFKGLGKEMYNFFEYASFIKGAKGMKGIAAPLNINFIQENDLYRFYKDRGVDVGDRDARLKKNYNPQIMKEYAKRISTYFKDGVIIKVVFPAGVKKHVMNAITKNAKTTSVISDAKEF